MSTVHPDPIQTQRLPLRVLLVDDNEPDVDQISRLLRKEYESGVLVHAVELVKQRLLRVTTALESAGLSYAVAGGNAANSADCYREAFARIAKLGRKGLFLLCLQQVSSS